MDKVFVFGVACAAAAGVVYAARPADEPRAEPPKPAVVARADPPPKPEPKIDPGERATFTTNPRLGPAFDMLLTDVRGASWSPDGRSLAVMGRPDPKFGREQLAKAIVGLINPGPDGVAIIDLYPGPTATTVRFTPDGKSVLTDVREAHLLSGRHELSFYDLQEDRRSVGRPRAVPLDSNDTHGYHFAADGKTFRTVAYEVGQRTSRYRDITVRAVSAATGKTLKTVITVEGEFWAYTLSADGKRLCVLDTKSNLAVHDVDRDRLLWAKSVKGHDGQPPDIGMLRFSPDGRRLAAVGSEVTVLYDATTGAPLPKLEVTDERGPGPVGFSADGRLFAGSMHQNTSGPPPYLSVWECDTGKRLKRWGQKAVIAFHPTKPILAVLEPNGNQTRLGLWDFAAETPK